MELVMWLAIGIVAVWGFIVLVPVLVVGTWYVVITVIMRLADGAIWLLDEGWRTRRGRKRRAEVQTKPSLGVGHAKGAYNAV
jgi:fatty acid desaturase